MATGARQGQARVSVLSQSRNRNPRLGPTRRDVSPACVLFVNFDRLQYRFFAPAATSAFQALRAGAAFVRSLTGSSMPILRTGVSVV